MSEWNVGDSASLSKTITEADVLLYAGLSNDTNPVHLDAEFARGTRFGQRIAHGLLVAGLISAVIGTRIPGIGAIYAGQTLRFKRPVYLGDTITATATISAYDRERGRMTLATVCSNQRGEEVLVGEAEIIYRPSVSVQPRPVAVEVASRNGCAEPSRPVLQPSGARATLTLPAAMMKASWLLFDATVQASTRLAAASLGMAGPPRPRPQL